MQLPMDSIAHLDYAPSKMADAGSDSASVGSPSRLTISISTIYCGLSTRSNILWTLAKGNHFVISRRRICFQILVILMSTIACGTQDIVPVTQPGTVAADLPPNAPRSPNFIYVAPSGDDSNPGVLAHPLASIQEGLDRLIPGDTLVVRGGAYVLANTLTLTRSGAEDQPIIIRNYPGEIPVIDGRRSLRRLFTLDDSSWVMIDGLTFHGAGGTRGSALAVRNSTDVILRNIIVRDVPDVGISLESTAHRVKLLNCDVSEASSAVEIAGHDILVDGCKAHDNTRMVDDGLDCDSDPRSTGDHGGIAFFANRTSGPVEIRNNEAWNNRAPSICYGYDGAFVELWMSQNINIHHNRMRDGVVAIETAGDQTGNRFWRNEVRNEQLLIAHQANSLLIANNTIWDSRPTDYALVWLGDGSGIFGDGSTAGFVLANNILAAPGAFFDLDQMWDPTATVDRNIYYPLTSRTPIATISGRIYDSLNLWQGTTGKDSHSLTTDPVVINVATADFKLQPTSPAVDKGMPLGEVTQGYVGAAPDIGLWEHLEPPATPAEVTP